MTQTPGKLIVLSGPSGVGKGTLRAQLAGQVANLVTSVSATTRPMRPTEVEGVDYFFLSRDDFEAKAQQGGFLEWAQYAENLYGTPRDFVETHIAQGHLVLLEIEVQGALAVKSAYPDAFLIFIAPPSLDELAARLEGRKTNHADDMTRRLKTAEWELSQAHVFDVTLVNDSLEACAQALCQTLSKATSPA